MGPNEDERARLNYTTGELDALTRLADARREIGELAGELLRARTSKRAEREDAGRRLNAIRASLGTVERDLATRRIRA